MISPPGGTPFNIDKEQTFTSDGRSTYKSYLLICTLSIYGVKERCLSSNFSGNNNTAYGQCFYPTDAEGSSSYIQIDDLANKSTALCSKYGRNSKSTICFWVCAAEQIVLRILQLMVAIMQLILT